MLLLGHGGQGIGAVGLGGRHSGGSPGRPPARGRLRPRRRGLAGLREADDGNDHRDRPLAQDDRDGHAEEPRARRRGHPRYSRESPATAGFFSSLRSRSKRSFCFGTTAGTTACRSAAGKSAAASSATDASASGALPWTLSSVRLKTTFGIAHQTSASAARSSFSQRRILPIRRRPDRRNHRVVASAASDSSPSLSGGDRHEPGGAGQGLELIGEALCERVVAKRAVAVEGLLGRADREL